MVKCKCKCGKSQKTFIKLHEGQIEDGDWRCEFCDLCEKEEEMKADFEVEEFFEDTSEEDELEKVEEIQEFTFEDLKKKIFESKEDMCCGECQNFECEKCECEEKPKEEVIAEPIIEIPKEEIKIKEKSKKKKKRGRKSKK